MEDDSSGEAADGAYWPLVACRSDWLVSVKEGMSTREKSSLPKNRWWRNPSGGSWAFDSV